MAKRSANNKGDGRGGPPAVYLIAGPDFGRREQAIRKIRAELEKRFGGAEASAGAHPDANASTGAGADTDASAGVDTDAYPDANARSGTGGDTSTSTDTSGDLEYSSYYADDVPVSELVATLYNRTLFHAHLLVVYRVDGIRGGDHQRLAKYIAAPSEQATLALVSENAKPSAAWARAIPNAHTITCWQPFDNEIHATIRQVFQSHRKRVSEELVTQIGAMAEQDSRLAEQLSRQIVYCFHSQSEITTELLMEFIDGQHATSIFRLTAQLFARDTQAALATLHRLHAEQLSSGQIASFVNLQTQKLWRVLYLIANRIPTDEALKQNGIMWRRQIEDFQTGLRSFTLPELSRLITHHRKMEADIRRLPEAYAYLLVTELILQMCEGRPLSLARDRRPALTW